MITEEIRKELFQKQDVQYRSFQSGLLPTVDPKTVIGVRTPELRKYAGILAVRADISDFLNDLPHPYFDENQLHAFLLSNIREYDRCMEEVLRFLPYVDNWATCDQLSPKVFKKHKSELLKNIEHWICTDEPYTVRFAIRMLMNHFLDESFDAKYPEMVANVRSEEYYVNMMVAWYFATALAEQYEAALPYFEEQRLEPWTHNKAIQKAAESFRIAPEQKEVLKSLRIRNSASRMVPG